MCGRGQLHNHTAGLSCCVAGDSPAIQRYRKDPLFPESLWHHHTVAQVPGMHFRRGLRELIRSSTCYLLMLLPQVHFCCCWQHLQSDYAAAQAALLRRLEFCSVVLKPHTQKVVKLWMVLVTQKLTTLSLCPIPSWEGGYTSDHCIFGITKSFSSNYFPLFSHPDNQTQFITTTVPVLATAFPAKCPFPYFYPHRQANSLTRCRLRVWTPWSPSSLTH